ncbi:MAG: type II secretion system protein [Actinobacteria bacterium]|nr:MAG: type II secretion system protein [Actinomycetota bacterium]
MRKALRHEGGFTLIELMIVVLIIGILVAIAIPVFQSVQNNARRRTCQANLRTLNGAIQSYAGDNEGNYPTALGDLDPNYVRVVPSCPGNGTTNGTYSFSGSGAAMETVCSLAGSDNHAI